MVPKKARLNAASTSTETPACKTSARARCCISSAARLVNATTTSCGSQSRAGSLSAVITTRVIEVLPNSDLVLEGIREVDINGDRQFIVLSGIVRAADIGPGNVVPSTAVGQMQIRYFGKGLIKDNLKPGWLVRALNKVF